MSSDDTNVVSDIIAVVVISIVIVVAIVLIRHCVKSKNT